MSNLHKPDKQLLKLLRKKGFDPLTYDSDNLIALYDGDRGLTTSAWEDQSGNGYDLTLYNTPTVVPNAINGHQVVRFDGVNQYGTRATTPVQNQPITKYIVFKQVTHTANDTICDSNNGNALRVFQNGVTPQIDAYSGIADFVSPAIPENTYDILTVVFNATNSEIRTNNNVAKASSLGVNNGTGITIASYGSGATYANCEIAYYIIRQGADDTATQNLYIDWLQRRFNTAFNPLTYDPNNLIAFYDGDQGLTTSLWEDQSANGYDLTLYNTPTVVSNARNGHGAVRFNGINQYGLRNATPIFTQPTTFYLVFQQLAWATPNTLIQCASADNFLVYDSGVTPNLQVYSGVTQNVTPQIPLNTYEILTVAINGVTSEVRTNNNVALVGNQGSGVGNGISLAFRAISGSRYKNCEVAYIIIRNSADDTATQNLYINWLKNRFAL